MSVKLPPHPDGEMPLRYTATCEVCKPRRALLFDNHEPRDYWTEQHIVSTRHLVTLGTMRGARK